MMEPTPEAVQEELVLVSQELAALRFRLKRAVAALPGAREDAEVDLNEEPPDLAAEVRSAVECVVTDYLTPAIADLETAALYRPSRKSGRQEKREA